MALLKIWRTIQRQGVRAAWRKMATVAPAYLGGIDQWRLRRCRCCERVTVFVAHRNGSPEFRACLFCSSNERYELLAAEIRERYGKRLPEMDVLELDPKSPLKPLLSRARSYTRTFYEEGGSAETQDGAICEDITNLRFEADSLDLIISSDVLEHVPRLEKALSETARVLRLNGAHIFTVPPRAATRKRAEIVDGRIVHIEPPDFHLDPLSPEGILAFWDIGPDLASIFPTQSLDIGIVRGPEGDSGRLVWLAEKSSVSAG
jgi:SAM-dependent methyltransferase